MVELTEAEVNALKRLSGAVVMPPAGSQSACSFTEVCADLSRRFCLARAQADGRIRKQRVFCEGATAITCECLDAWEALNLEVQAESGLCLGCPSSLSENMKVVLGSEDVRTGRFTIKHGCEAAEDPWCPEP